MRLLRREGRGGIKSQLYGGPRFVAYTRCGRFVFLRVPPCATGGDHVDSCHLLEAKIVDLIRDASVSDVCTEEFRLTLLDVVKLFFLCVGLIFMG